MGCRCQERRVAITRAAGAVLRGDVNTAARNVAFVGRSAAEDIRNAALRRDMAMRLARLRMPRRA
jgi:hypothetical protein